MNFTHLTDELSKYDKDRIVFVGLGNELREDDGAGLELVERLKSKKIFHKSHFLIARRNPENHLEAILNYNPQVVIFIDAAEWNGNPGEIKIFNDDEISKTEFSTHTFSITMIKDFLLKNQQMNFMFVGIKPFSTSFKEGLSEPVKIRLKEFFDDNV
jgi:hydrogenase 3 maturation protease